MLILFGLLLFGITRGDENVEKIIFQGNTTFTTRTLRKLINTKIKLPLDEADLAQDLQTIKTFYQNEGFLSIQVENELETGKLGKIVYFSINEGQRVKIITISIAGYFAFSEEKVNKLLNLKINEYLITSELEEAVKRVVDFYKNSGYPYISVEYETKVNDNQADIYFTIQE